MSRANERIRCVICNEWATHECHVYSEEWFNNERSPYFGTRNTKEENIILLCQTHHGVYFDKHHGPRGGPGHMLIDLDRNSLFVIDPLIRNPEESDIKEYGYFEHFNLKPEYVVEKNRKCIDALYCGWINLFGNLVWD